MTNLRTTIGRLTIERLVPPVFRVANRALMPVLGSPLHATLDWYVAVIRVTGRRTGRTYEIPFAYHRDGEAYVGATSRKGRWWRNLVGGADAQLLMGGRWRSARAEAIEDVDAIAHALGERDLFRRALMAIAPEDAVLVRVTVTE